MQCKCTTYYDIAYIHGNTSILGPPAYHETCYFVTTTFGRIKKFVQFCYNNFRPKQKLHVAYVAHENFPALQKSGFHLYRRDSANNLLS